MKIRQPRRHFHAKDREHQSTRRREVTAVGSIDFMQHQGRETQSRLQVYNYALIHDVSACVPPVGLFCASLQSGEQR